MTTFPKLDEAEIAEANLQSTDKRTIHQALIYFERNLVPAISRLPMIAFHIDNPDIDIRGTAIRVLSNLAHQDPSAMRNYAAPLAYRLQQEEDLGISHVIMQALEPVVVCDDPSLIKPGLESIVGHLGQQAHDTAANILRIVAREKSFLIETMSEAAWALLKHHDLLPPDLTPRPRRTWAASFAAA